MASRKVKFDFDPFEIAGVDKPRGEIKEQILESVADFVAEEVRASMESGVSPVSGEGKYKALSKLYKKKKIAEGLSGSPDLFFTGDLQSSIEVEFFKNKLRLTVPQSEQGKADGHNNFSGKSELPTRAFIPNASEDQTFKRHILSGIRDIVLEALDGEVSDKDES